MEQPKPIRPKRVAAPRWSVTHHVTLLSYSEDDLIEETTAQVGAHDIDAILPLLPPDVFAFTMYDLKEADVWVEGDLCRVGKTEAKSGRYYVGGHVYTAEEVEVLAKDVPEDFEGLMVNVRDGGLTQVIQTRLGNWQPFNDGDTSLPAYIS